MEPEAAKNFEQNFRSLERLWEAVSPDPCLYPHRIEYNWLCAASTSRTVGRQRGGTATYGELSAKTKELIEENTTFVEMAESLPVLKIDQDYAGKLDALPTPADKAAALEAMLTAELSGGRTELRLSTAGREAPEDQGTTRGGQARPPPSAWANSKKSRARPWRSSRNPCALGLHSPARYGSVHNPAGRFLLDRRDLHRRLLSAHGRPPAPSSASGDGMEQFG